ncbi:GNAT family N-acetyltransferase [Streptococcus saliviloxodontae]|uniref:Ribosomal-protein-alanine N-acetyltransferase n=1 Tax=Streptococcus saliviloxodontae TaxID=1349416 RepID=A0ABS2PLC3_9STRE|nr:GNAT family N-acetyltransferase [Streptococcus saliviloxodontae]MBM7636161.1 ribosomal-protein-alanine N-acetyltransferase [Streptococcus saliviloxodontae]
MDIWVNLARFSEIETQGLLLKPVSFKDASDFYELTRDPDNLPFIFPARASRFESDYLLVHYFLKEPLGKWAIFDKSSQEFLGMINLESIQASKGWAEIGYFVKRSHWGKGIMTETLRTLSEIAFDAIGFQKLIIITHQENVASQVVAQKAGFHLVKHYKGSDRYTHKMRDYFRFELKKDDMT